MLLYLITAIYLYLDISLYECFSSLYYNIYHVFYYVNKTTTTTILPSQSSGPYELTESIVGSIYM